jgi:ATP-dependent DNA helicase RecG
MAEAFVKTINFESAVVIIIQISSVTGMPVSIRGRYFRRTARTNQRMSHEEIMQRMITSTGISWDAVAETASTLEDLNSIKIATFIEGIKKKGRLTIPEQATDQEILRKLELIKNDIPTRAALLLFGNNPESYFSSAFLKIGRFRSSTHIVDDREIHDTLIDQLTSAMNWFRERLQTEFIITGKPERDVRWEYPLEAIREAVINALCHRDYTSLAHTQIRLYDDRLEIRNAGGLPPALTPEALFHEHDSMPRNRKIAECFFYVGFIERWGSGTLRMIEELQSAEFPPPQFISESGHFKLSFHKQLFTDEFLKKLELSERQLKAISYIKEHGKITNTEYQAIANISKRTATRELNELKKKDLLVSEGSTGRGIFYRLKKKD